MTETARRPTRQRAAVEALLVDIDDFNSAQNLHARLRAQGQNVGLATVYRTLQAMATDGDVDMLRTVDGEAVQTLQHRPPSPPHRLSVLRTDGRGRGTCCRELGRQGQR